MPASDIIIRGAREHNLRDVDVRLPRNQLICLTGVSGSGKSSLAFDTLFAEGQRRYVESLSTFARQFLGQMPKPDVDHISGLSPSISISQKSSGNNPRSTVGTITEIYDFLRVLYARVGTGHCPSCSKPIAAQTREEIIGRIMLLENKTRFAVLAPMARRQKGEFRDLFEDLQKRGFVRARVDGEVVQLSDAPALDRQMRHNIEVVVDRLVAGPSVRGRLGEAVDSALKLGKGDLIIAVDQGDDDAPAKPAAKRKRAGKTQSAAVQGDIAISAHFACTDCGLSFDQPTPQLFSFNSPQGMCETCDGIGEFFSFDPQRLVPDPEKSFAKGAIELVGTWKDLGRWKRHIYQGVADTMERLLEIEEGTLLETPWGELTEDQQNLWLWGTGEEHITYTWRAGKSSQKYGGEFDGVIPQLLDKYSSSKSKAQIAKYEQYMRIIECPDCNGARLNPQACAVTLETADKHFAEKPKRSLPELCQLPISDAQRFFSELNQTDAQAYIAEEVLKEIRGRLGFLANVGLEYLSLDRTAPTLSGGESQRIRLAGQIGCGLVGVLYILDEPSIGLHPRDNDRLLGTLRQLRDMGNTVVVVEHDEDTMRAADLLIDFGPGPGVRGGEVVAVGDWEKVAKSEKSQTGAFLGGRRKIEVPKQRRISSDEIESPSPAGGARSSRELRGGGKSSTKGDPSCNGEPDSQGAPTPALPQGGREYLRVRGARHNNLKNIDVEIPLGAFVCITGASGSGKSSLVNDILMEALRRDLMNGKGDPGEHDAIEGIEHLDKVISIDQSPIGRTPRSNPGTYIKVFDDIRNLFAQLPESKRRGYKPGRFSFNVASGRCQACEGNGSNKLEMDFLADVWVTCPVCNGHRFNRETLQVEYKGASIADVLEMDLQQALAHFDAIPQISHKLQTLHDVGLDYLKVGQPSPTLSGGEAQRIKLARELVKKSTGKTLYMLDEPTTGLHFADIEMLLKVLHNFVELGNTVVVIEHNLDVIKTADWVIDIGPDGGAGGGRIVAAGTPEQIVADFEASGKNNKSPSPAGGGARGGGSNRVPASPPPLTPPPLGEGDFVSPTAKALAPLLNGGHASTAKKQARKAVKQAKYIEVRGARQHNLRGVDLKIPREEMTVFCGPSGSGKSSLAMDTIYAEGQRRYVESLSSYARQFVGQMQKPALDHIEGLSPAIAIEQRSTGHTPRSTVGTVTEIYDYLRVLYARLAQLYCPECDLPVGTQTSDQIVDKLLTEPEGTKLFLLAPVEVGVGESYADMWKKLQEEGYLRVRIDGKITELEKAPKIDRRKHHDVAVVVDRLSIQQKSRARIAEAVEGALSIGHGVLQVVYPDDKQPETRWQTRTHSQHLACEGCGRSFTPLTPHNFSFNSSLGWCQSCEGLGTQTGADPAALLRDADLTLERGALLVWPDVSNELSMAMLQALSHHTGVPIDTPYDRLSAKQRRVVLYGTGEEWIDVALPQGGSGLSFQFKGLYPALEEASRLSVRLRTQLEHLVAEIECSDCGGSRLRDDASAAQFRSLTIEQICRLPLGELLEEIQAWNLDARETKIAGELVREIANRLTFLVEVGLEYLTVGRGAPTLSGGESQRIRLASQVGSGLVGVLYVLDEPTIGLHPRDNTRLIGALHKLRDLGNTLLIVEHDKEVVESADGLVDFGPAAGRFGGEIVAQGSPEAVSKKRKSVTGPYLSGKKNIAIPSNRRIDAAAEGGKRNAAKQGGTEGSDSPLPLPPSPFLQILGARHNNLKHVDAQIPLGAFVAVTGVSGSGKSSLINEILYNQLARTLHRAGTVAGAHDDIRGVEHINKVIRVDQTPLGNSPSSNPATYTGAFDLIRQLFAQLPDAKLRGYSARQFSFNVAGGRCDACDGAGEVCVEMHFLPDVWIKCETCNGHRYNPDTLAVKYRGRSIADVLELSCGEALELFDNIPKVRRVLQTLCDVGLDYVTLGQSAPTLSGGEAQRVKLAAELARPDTGQTLYLLDEPTTGLHFDDLAKLLDVLNRLVDLGNTVLVIEHNLDVIKTADWIIDVGPEAGKHGGRIVAAGTPEMVVASHQASAASSKSPSPEGGARSSKELKGGGEAGTGPEPPPLTPPPAGEGDSLHSHTAEALAPVLAAGPYKKRKAFNQAAFDKEKLGDVDLDEFGQDVAMPWEEDGQAWHCENRVSQAGDPVMWDGEILRRVESYIQDLGDELGIEWSPTNWNHRSIVEVTGEKKTAGWFLHALTSHRWLLNLKFRTAKKTFQRDQLTVDLDLKSLNEIDEIPAYGNGPRVKCKNLRGPWQEVQVHVHSFEEIDTPAFWGFVKRAAEGFKAFTERSSADPDAIMPWKVMGQKWHLARKGFPPGKKPKWSTELLEEVFEMLEEATPKGQFLWNNKVLVHRMAGDRPDPWATVVTKRLANVELALNGPKGAFQLGRVTDLGVEQELTTDHDERDTVRLRFVEPDDLQRGDLEGFLREHLEACQRA
ncbi:UvrABC system protein A [Posidoniimonas polymericola]|uniref:UvrABC system protein A n=1 Tax=Posidoniimonas polymericola TaxID=2528002 RepID=A0A5C5ZE26_9BACT|nr:excinuclease ABC subunit UvrA [Posidoniimonas polymericola]TWT85327.1 UvrABC system protein A [Posidoniimonas polymericola]